MLKFMTIKKFAVESGYSEDAIRSKIRDGVWIEGQVWIKAPDERSVRHPSFHRMMWKTPKDYVRINRFVEAPGLYRRTI